MYEELVKNLMELGLKNYEARAYTVIALLGEATAPVIAERAGIPMSKIYSVLKSLEKKGLIECQSGRPRIYRITDPELNLSNLIKTYEEKKDAVVKMLRNLRGTQELTRGGVWIVRGTRNICRRIKEVIRHTDSCIAFAAPDFIYKEFIKDLVHIGRSGKTLSLVIYETDESLTAKLAEALGKYSKVKRRMIPTVLTVLVDRKVGISSYHPLSEDEIRGHTYAIVIEDESLLRLLNDFFHLALWLPSDELKFNLATSFKKPQKYTHFWRAVEDAKYFISKGYTVQASVKGRLTKTGEPVSIKGKVLSAEIGFNWLKYSLIISAGNRKYEVGGWGCFMEEVEGLEVTLYPPKLKKS